VDDEVADDCADLLAEFIARAEPLGVRVVRVASSAEAATAIAAWARELGAERAAIAPEAEVVAPEIAAALVKIGVRVEHPAVTAAMRDVSLGVSLARLAIAETGSVLLAEPGPEDRAVGMLSLAHVTLCPTGSLVATLDDAVAELRALALRPGGSFSTLVTGPSRTADIERQLTIGVQGPGKVMTVFVDDLQPLQAPESPD
jgi:L-lactate dehydrogenase complex protein LldG